MIAPSPPAASNPPAVARLGEHRIGHGAERHRGGHAAAGRPPKQERGQHDGAPGAGGLAPHRGEREVDEELAGAGHLQEGAVDGEEYDERGGYIHRHSEDPLQRHIHVANEPRDVIAAVRPRLAQVRAEHRVNHEQHAYERHDPASSAARRFQHEQRQDHAEHHVQVGRDGAAIGEIVAAEDAVADDNERDRGPNPVPPHDAVTVAAGKREQQIAQEQHEADVHHAQLLRRHDGVGRIEVEERHDDGHHHHEAAEVAGQAVGRALLCLDVLLGLLERSFVDRDVVRRGNVVNQILVLAAHRARLRPAPLARKKKKSSARRAGFRSGPVRPEGYLTLSPFSRKYLTAPGWNGITIAALV